MRFGLIGAVRAVALRPGALNGGLRRLDADILVALGQPAAVAAQTGRFARASLPGLWAAAFSTTLSKV